MEFPTPPHPPTPGVTPRKEVLTGGRGAPKGGIRPPAPRRRSMVAALRVQRRAKGSEAHTAYVTAHALSPSRTREKVHALCLRPQTTPLRFRPPKRGAALCFLHACRRRARKRSNKVEGGSPLKPPAKIRARKTGKRRIRNGACLSDRAYGGFTAAYRRRIRETGPMHMLNRRPPLSDSTPEFGKARERQAHHTEKTGAVPPALLPQSPSPSRTPAARSGVPPDLRGLAQEALRLTPCQIYQPINSMSRAEQRR